MKCPCPIDHWLHVVGGLQGIVSMMDNLANADIHASGEAVNRLKDYLGRLQEQLRRQESNQCPKVEG